jgi:putative ABC transport system permease protein
MSIPLAWHNTLQNKKRSFAAVAGIAFSLLLIFMQLGFLNTAKTNSTIVYNYFVYDLIITSNQFEALDSAHFFDRARLLQSRVVPGVQSVATLNTSTHRWRDPENDDHMSSCMMIGYDLNPAFVPVQDREALTTLTQRDTVMVDSFSHPRYGRLVVGREVSLRSRPVTISALYEMGVGFQTRGSVITSNDTYSAIYPRSSREVIFGLVQITPGADPLEVKRRLRESLPNDVAIFTKQELVERESNYYVNVKPIGIMFRAGAFVAFCVGGVILYQVLSSEISNRLRELATLRAVGFSDFYVYSVGVQQAVIFAALSYGPAFGFSMLTYHIVYVVSHIPMFMTWPLALTVLGLAIIMTTVSSVLALQKVKRADPADLF